MNDPELNGPDLICNVFGSILIDYSGGGNPATDVYSWKILGPSAQTLFSGSGGAGFQTISYTFSLIGIHQINLIVSRGGLPIGNFTKSVNVIQGPVIELENEYKICESQEIELTALSPSSPELSKYIFDWKDSSGAVIGTENILKTKIPGTYEVTFYFIDGKGERACETVISTEVILSSDFSISGSANFICPGGSITFTSTPQISGSWFLQKDGDSKITILGGGSSKTVTSGSNLSGAGDYTITLEVPNPTNPACVLSSSGSFTFNPQPEIEFFSSNGSGGCFLSDGVLELTALTPIDKIGILGSSSTFGPFQPGEIITIPGLKSGAFTLAFQLGNCTNTLGSIVPLLDPPAQLSFEITNIESEICTPTGKENGSFVVNLLNGPIPDGSYRIKNKKGGMVQNEKLGNDSQFEISIPGGSYFFEIFDKDSCNLPNKSEFEVPGLTQVAFTAPNNLSICQAFDLIPQTSQNLEFSLFLPDGTKETKGAGAAFSLTLPGEYNLVGSLPGQDLICPLARKFTVALVDPVDYEPLLINQDCFGNLTYQANIFGRSPATVKFRWLDENDKLVGTGQFLNPVSFGIYKLDVQPSFSTACPIPPIEFEIKKPIVAVDVSFAATKLCEFGPRAVINLTSTFPEEITDIEWRRYDDLGNIENLPQFNDSTQITVNLEGTYEAAVFSRIPSVNKNCEFGRQIIDVDLIPAKVPFDVPGSLSICEPYSLIPISATALEFELNFPDGKVEIKNWNVPFILDQEGTYTILGYNSDIKGPLCPDQKTIEVKINAPVDFDQELIEISCSGEYQFQALLINYDPEEVDFYWRDSNNNLVGSQLFFSTSTYGTFTLEVQPKGSIPCRIQPISFDATQPILNVDAQIISETLCPDHPDAALKLNADLEAVQTIEWWYTDLSNNSSILPINTDKQEILAFEEGTYEVRLINSFGCILGTAQQLVIRSTDQIRPNLDEVYQICPRYEIAPILNPGSFASYEWYFESSVVSNSPTFKPLQLGSYRLLVVSDEGCAYETSFVTEEECELRVVFPNAIQPDDPNKPFLIYTNYLIDELEIWIFSKWGEVIFHCKQTELLTEEFTCIWDGYLNGKKIPPGSYAYRMNYRNNERNIMKEQLGSIFVID